MNRFLRICYTILFVLPMAILFSGLLYLLIEHYEQMWASFWGPTLMIPTFMLGGYILSLFINTSGMIKKEGLKFAIRHQVVLPWFNYFPKAILVIVFFWLWMQGAMISMYMATEGLFPPDLGMLFAFLMFVNEFFKVIGRGGILDKVQQKRAEEGQNYLPDLDLSIKQLRVLNHVQSVLYIVAGWGIFVVGCGLIHHGLGDYLAPYIEVMLYLGVLIAGFYVIMRQEKRLEQWGREQHYLPWDTDKDV